MQEELIEHELPPRPRHRLLGAGGNPLAVALLCVLLCACGFIGGVLVEKGQGGTSSSSGTSGGLASRLAALRGSSGPSTRGGGLAALLTGSGASGAGAAGGGSSAPTVGQVAYVDGHTLYVTNFEGNTIKITASAGANVTRTVKSDVGAIHPGETVIISGSRDSSGAVHAQSIRASEASASGGFGGAALFGGGGGSGGGSRSQSTGGGEGAALFGK